MSSSKTTRKYTYTSASGGGGGGSSDIQVEFHTDQIALARMEVRRMILKTGWTSVTGYRYRKSLGSYSGMIGLKTRLEVQNARKVQWVT